MNKEGDRNARAKLEIAVIGMSGRFPGAANIDEFWDNLKNGVEAIAFFSDEELKARGIEPGLLKNPNYVKAKAFIKNIEYFDASFFGYTLAEAEIMNPQLRIFHECAWEALEDAAYDPGSYNGLIGLYAGASSSSYWESLSFLSGKTSEFGYLGGMTLTDKDFLSTRLSYKLNLKGPSSFVQTACSTSLVAIHMACRAVLSGECDMALAGGISITEFQHQGYMYEPGMILSPDGHCRAFDERATGTLQGNGIGIVVLKRLKNAIEDKNHIYAVIKGSAINNDGSRKVGYTAPSVDGQAQAIRTALAMARLEPESITYIETHGTGTNLGDPVEIAALKLAFKTNKKGFCLIGSVKTNIGHLDAAAGVAGFIKTVLALKHRLIPPSLHFENPNPKFDLNNFPFDVNTTLREWKNDNYPLRAGVSSFGIGGTNAHVILEQAPEVEDSPGTRNWKLLVVSAKTASALERAAENLVEFLKNHPEINLADAAYTLQVGRCAFPHRRMVVCSDLNSAIEALSSLEPGRHPTFHLKKENTSVIFMFPGLGSQYVNMGLGLYETEPVFREEIDRCFEILSPLPGYDIKEILYPRTSVSKVSEVSRVSGRKWEDGKIGREEDRQIGKNPHHSSFMKTPNHFEVAQVVVFIFEYALAKLLMNWGVKPHAMIGYSFGEYTAACLSGVFSLEDALKLIVVRGQLIGRGPGGSMLSVPLRAEELISLLPGELSLAIDNGPSCIVSGTGAAVDAFEKQLREKRCLCMKLPHANALHSKMMEPFLKEFEALVGRIKLNRPQIPYISNVTGKQITPRETVDPAYWARHLRETVRFADGINELKKNLNPVFIEVGPGRDLHALLVRHKEDDENSKFQAVNLIPPELQKVPADRYLLRKIGQLWLYGVTIDWQEYYPREKRYRIPLPTYCFDHQRYWFGDNLFKLGEEMLLSRALYPKKKDMAQVMDYMNRPATGEESIADAFESRKTTGSLHERPELDTPYVPPTNEIEKTLADIWQKFFGIDRIGIDDDFFELGGDSLSASTVIARIHRELDVLVTMPVFFSHPTIKSLSVFIAGDISKSIYSSIEPVEKKEYYPSSSTQRRLYVLWQLDDRGIAYNIPYVCTLEGNIDKKRLEDTFTILIKRHESLRTSFHMIGEEPVQKINEDVTFEIKYFDFINVHEGEIDVKEIIKNFTGSFDLSQAPLFRVGLIKENQDKMFLVLDMHHIVTDGTSMGLFIRDFMAVYGRETLPDLRMHYKDFTVWYNSQYAREFIKQQEAFWIREFKGEIPVLNLPTDFSRPVFQNFDGSVVGFEIDKEKTTGLKECFLKEGTTMFMVLLAIYNIFLSKVSGQEDMVVGIPIAGRSHSDLEQIIGAFVNTLAMRNFPGGEKNVKQFLEEVKARTLESFSNQDYLYEELVEGAPVVRDTSRNPLFDTMFMLQNFDIPELDIPGLNLKPYTYDQGTSRFDLTLQAIEMEETLLCTFEYSTKLFKPVTIERFTNYFKKIISVVIEDPAIKIMDIEIISQEERKQLLFDFNAANADYPKEKTIYELFEEQVNRTPDNISLVFEGQQLSYSALNDRANRAAWMLKGKGVRVDIIIGIMPDRSLEMLIGIMGILKAGGAYLPIDPQYPEERIKYMLKESGTGILLTRQQPGKQSNEKPHHIHTGEIVHLNEKLLNEYEVAENKIEDTSAPTDLAYVIYTSGSTGRPKGVSIGHKNVINFITGITAKIPFSAEKSILALTTVSFDIFVLETLLPLVNGLKVVIATEDQQKDPQLLADKIEKENVNMLQVTPSSLKLLMDGDIGLSCLENVDVLMVGGESFPQDLFERLRIDYKGYIYDMYGPTETTVWSTVRNLTDVQKIDIGTPIANTRIFIIDAYDRLLPVGVAGELCIGGDGLARGYLNRPGLTHDKFKIINDKLKIKNGNGALRADFNAFGETFPLRAKSQELRAKLYKTGDLARWLPDGNIDCLGRIDTQVKLRGFRIELGEIESQLLTHDEIKETVVVAKGDDKGDNYLCAYIVSEIELDVSELRGFLSVKLPNYMIPSYFVLLESIPLTPNGKVDRKALPQPEIKVGEGDTYVAPRNRVEEKLSEIWSEVLAIEKEKISIDANFFHLGGHSLNAIAMVSKIHKELQVRMPLTEIFKNPNIKGISKSIAGLKKEKYKSIEPVEKKEYHTLSSAQMRMYIIHQMDVESIAYNMPMMASLEIEMLGEEVEKKKLADTIRRLIERHENLRTSFEMINGQPVQRIYHPGDVDFEIEYRHLREKNMAKGGLVMEEISRNFIRPFHLARAPLLRVAMVEVENKEYILMVDMHHIISDFTSDDILFREFMARYRGEELPLMRIQYKDFSEWQNSEEIKNSIKSQQEYWLNELQGEIPLLNLPLDYPRSSKTLFRGSRLSWVIDPALTSRLIACAAEFEVTLMIFLFSVYNILLAKYTGQEEIVVGTAVSGRRHSDLENIIGFFVNMLAIKTRPAKNKIFREYLLDLKEKAVNSYENQEYPFEELISQIKLPREPGRHPLVETLFTFQEETRQTGARDREVGDAPLNAFRVSHFDILLYSTKNQDSIPMFFEYSTDLFKETTIEELSHFYMDILTQVIENPDIRLKEIEISLGLLPSTSDVIWKDKDDWGI